MNDLRLPDDCWTAPDGPLDVGDVLVAVPFVTLRRLSDIVREEEVGTGWLAPVRMAYGIVLKVIEGQALIGEVATVEGSPDEIGFENLLELGNDAPEWVTLPRLPHDGGHDGWWEAAFLTFFTPTSFSEEIAEQLRVRSLVPEARTVLSQRLARCFEV
jgi:hypothetical protein